MQGIQVCMSRHALDRVHADDLLTGAHGTSICIPEACMAWHGMVKPACRKSALARGMLASPLLV